MKRFFVTVISVVFLVIILFSQQVKAAPRCQTDLFDPNWISCDPGVDPAYQRDFIDSNTGYSLGGCGM